MRFQSLVKSGEWEYLNGILRYSVQTIWTNFGGSDFPVPTIYPKFSWQTTCTVTVTVNYDDD